MPFEGIHALDMDTRRADFPHILVLFENIPKVLHPLTDLDIFIGA